MRTTLTLDDDVAAILTRLQKTSRKSLKGLVNEALRHGLKQLTSRPKPSKAYRTPSLDLGRCRFANLDDVAEVLAVAEGDSFK
jgi:hypothetical protein